MAGNELPPYFVSHSGADRGIVDIIVRIFECDERRGPIIMTTEELSVHPEGHWWQIRNGTHESDAVLLILSRGQP